MYDKKTSELVIDGLSKIIKGVEQILEADFEKNDNDINEYLMPEGYETVAPHEHIFPNLSLDEWAAVLQEYKEYLEKVLLNK